jgi:hypothetical protein
MEEGGTFTKLNERVRTAQYLYYILMPLIGSTVTSGILSRKVGTFSAKLLVPDPPIISKDLDYLKLLFSMAFDSAGKSTDKSIEVSEIKLDLYSQTLSRGGVSTSIAKRMALD